MLRWQIYLRRNFCTRREFAARKTPWNVSITPPRRDRCFGRCGVSSLVVRDVASAAAAAIIIIAVIKAPEGRRYNRLKKDGTFEFG